MTLPDRGLHGPAAVLRYWDRLMRAGEGTGHP